MGDYNSDNSSSSVGGLSNTPAPVIGQELDVQAKALNALHLAIDTLAKRLQPVCRLGAEKGNADEGDTPKPMHSVVAEQLSRNTRDIISAQTRLVEILGNLEV